MLPLPRLLVRTNPRLCAFTPPPRLTSRQSAPSTVQSLIRRLYATGKPHTPPQYPKPTSNASAQLNHQVRPPLGATSSKLASKSTFPQAKATNSPPKKDPGILPFSGTHGTLPSTASLGKTGATSGYPERLLIYDAGTGRTVFLSVFKLTAIFIFIAGAGFFAPHYYYDPASPAGSAGLIVLVGAIPLILMSFTTAPFVTYVHLTLPSWARMSAARLHRLAENLPASAVLDVTTLRWIWPRVTRLTAGELYLKSGKMTGAMTLRRQVPQTILNQRKWWQWRPLSTFYVAGKGGKTIEKGVWEEVMSSVSKGWAQRERERIIR